MTDDRSRLPASAPCRKGHGSRGGDQDASRKCPAGKGKENSTHPSVGVMNWTSRTNAIKVGDRVCYNRRFLQSTGQFTGATPQGRGVVKALVPLGETTLAEIEWNDDELPERVNVANLACVTKKGIIYYE